MNNGCFWFKGSFCRVCRDMTDLCFAKTVSGKVIYTLPVRKGFAELAIGTV